MGGSVLLSFCVLYASVTAVSKAAPLISEQASDRYQFTPAHWIMMGLKDLGAFNFEDSDFSQSFETKAERQEAEVNEIVKRASGKGFFGMVVHIGTKASWTYMDGTYYIANYLGHYRHKTALHSLVLYDGEFRFPFYVYSKYGKRQRRYVAMPLTDRYLSQKNREVFFEIYSRITSIMGSGIKVDRPLKTS